MKKKALLIGSSFSAAPMLNRLRRRGLKVAVCGSARHDPCHQYADESHFIDYSDRESLLQLVQGGEFDYLVPSCNDYSYMSGAWVAQITGHPGFDRFSVAEALHTKHQFRAESIKWGIPVPAAIEALNGQIPDVPENMYPILVKPVDSFSGRGIAKISSPDDLQIAVNQAVGASRSAGVIIEQFVSGQLHSHSAFVSDGRIALDFFVDEFCTVYPYQVDSSNHPSCLNENIRSSVRQSMQTLIEKMELANGLLHTQFIADGQQVWIIETMRRCPGDLYSGLIERSTGVDYTDQFIAGFLGERCHLANPGRVKFMGRHTLSASKPAPVHSFSFSMSAGHSSIVPLKASGEVLRAAPYDKLAILFHEFESMEEMIERVPDMKDHVRIGGFDFDKNFV